MAWHTELVSELFDSKRLRRILVATAAACAFYPAYFFIVYMAERGFYAFEAFGNVLGMIVPFLFMAFIFGVLLMLLTVMFWSGPMLVFIALVTSSRDDGSLKRDLLAALPKCLFNLLLWGVVLWAEYKSDTPGRVFTSFALTSGILAAILAFFSVTKGANRASLAIVLAGVALFIPVVAQEQVQDWVEATLRQFRLGGVAVTVSSGDRSPEVAYLVFLSPSNVYLEIGCPARTVILPRSGLRLEFEHSRLPGAARCAEAPASSDSARR